jgi:hypothetical protein
VHFFFDLFSLNLGILIKVSVYLADKKVLNNLKNTSDDESVL